jgi:hypothetical protein
MKKKKPAPKKKPVAKPLPKAAAKKKKLAAKRPPAKRKTPPLKPQKLTGKPRETKPLKPQVLTERGTGLVELAIAADRERRDPTDPPRPLTRAQIDQLAMPDGREVPASLARWLAYDTLDIFEGKQPTLRWRSFADMMREQFDDETAQQFADFGKLLTGQCLALPDGADSRRFLYAGQPDGHGEYPIFVVATDELPWVGLAYPGFDAYIAEGRVANVITGDYLDAWQHQHWAPYLEHHARANFRGFKALDYQSPEHLRRTRWPSCSATSCRRKTSTSWVRLPR